MRLEDFPNELITKRNEIEGNFVMSLYKEPDLIDDYSNVVNGEDMLTDDGCFYYGLAQNMYKMGYRVFDNVSINTYLKDKDVLREGFERRGGYKTIQDITSIIDTDNIETNYDELIKNNLLLRLHNQGFPVINNLSKLNEMSSEEVYDYFDYMLNNITVGKIEKVKAVSLSRGYKEYFDDWDSGLQIGFPISSPLLNSKLAGIHKSNFVLHCAYIGQGKTTTSIILYVLPVIERGENVLILANEQTKEEWYNMMASAVLYNKIHYYGMNRSKITKGSYTKEQREKLDEAAKWLGEDGRGNVELIELQDYNISRIKKVVKRYSKLGYGMVILDTLKPNKENSDKAWAEFSESAKEIFQITKKEGIALVATAQLAGDSMGRKHLDLSCIGKSKAIAETATQVVMFRFLFQDEKERLQPFTIKKDEETGKYTNVRELHTLDPNKSYIIVFIPKNRFGETNQQIVMEFSQSFMSLHDVGFVEISPNSR